MAYSHPGSLSPAYAPRLGWRARRRAARDARLGSERARRRTAEDIEAAVARADAPYGPFTAAVPVASEAVGEARDALLDLAERLRAPRAVDPDGVRQARALLIDGSGPLYAPQEPGELRRAARRALQALDGERVAD